MKTRLFIAVLLFLPIWLAATEMHAILLVSEGQEKQVAQSLDQAGGRVAVTAGNIWMVRIPAESVELLRKHPGIERITDHSSAIKLDKPNASEDLPGYLAYVKNALPGKEDEKHYAADGPCGIETNYEPNYGDPAKSGTSDLMIGSSAVAVILMRQTDELGPPAFEWTPEILEETKANIMLNVAWWSDRAADYNVDKSFLIRFYEPSDSITHIPWDPTMHSTHAWRSRIMDNLGYTGETLTERMRAFADDLREDMETDWGFLAFVFFGESYFRSNAMIFGPATNVYGPAARSGLVFAHEMGHIYGLRDEYAEVSSSTYDYVLNGLANLNADFRNHIHAPCMMKNNWGLCSYNPVHLQWIDEVELTTIRTSPEDAHFEVAFLHPVTMHPGQFVQRFRGETRLPLGRHMLARLEGLDHSVVGHQVFSGPEWDDTGQSVMQISVDAENPGPEHMVSYHSTGEEADLEITYLRAGIEVPGRRIYAMDNSQEGVIGMASEDGTGIFFHADSLLFLEPPMQGSAIPNYRPSEDLSYAGNAFYFPSLRGEVVRWEDGHVSILGGREVGQSLSKLAADGQGRIYALGGSGRETQGDLIMMEEDGLQRFNPQNSDLRDLNISTLYALPDGRLLIGYDGGRTGNETRGLQLFDPSALAWQNLDDLLSDTRVIRIRKHGDSIYVLGHNRVTLLSEQLEFVTEHDFDHIVPRGHINDLLPAINEGYFLGTNNGLIHYRGDSDWTLYDRQTSEASDNNITALARDASNRIIASTMNNGAMTFHFKKDEDTTPVVEFAEPRENTLALYPNPASAEVWIRGHEQMEGSESLIISLLDTAGRVIQQTEARYAPAIRLSLAGLPSGTYFLLMHSGKKAFQGKIMVTE